MALKVNKLFFDFIISCLHAIKSKIIQCVVVEIQKMLCDNPWGQSKQNPIK